MDAPGFWIVEFFETFGWFLLFREGGMRLVLVLVLFFGPEVRPKATFLSLFLDVFENLPVFDFFRFWGSFCVDLNESRVLVKSEFLALIVPEV